MLSKPSSPSWRVFPSHEYWRVTRLADFIADHFREKTRNPYKWKRFAVTFHLEFRCGLGFS